MGGERFKSLSVSEAVYNKLREIAARRGFSTLADTVAYLATLEELVLRRLESITASTGNDTTSSGNVATTSGNHPVATNTAVKPPSKAKTSGKLTAWDILKRDKVSCMSDIKARNPVRVIEALFRGGAVKIDLGHDVCVVEPSFWWEFWHTLQNVKTPDDNEVLSYLKSEKMRQLFTRLRSPQQLIYLDAKSRSWVYDAEHIEIPREALEATRSSEKEEHYEPEDLYR